MIMMKNSETFKDNNSGENFEMLAEQLRRRGLFRV